MPTSTTPLTLTTPDGTVTLVSTGHPDRTRVTLHPNRPDLYVPLASCETTLPPAVVQHFLTRSFASLCDTLSRHEPDDSVHRVLDAQLRAYEGDDSLAGQRVLDFGCGTGGSTVHLALRYPAAEVIGVELDATYVADATLVLEARGLRNARVLRSPSPTTLPDGIGPFDVIVLSAVYEHLLPEERRTVLPALWRALRPGGRLYISQTPYRWFPYEHHSTGVWGINYLPDWLAHRVAARFARIYPDANARRTWPEHLRGGLRGGTEWEVLADLRRASDGHPRVMQPRCGSRARYWLEGTSPRHRWLKRVVATGFAASDRLLGTVPSLNLDVAIRKDVAH